MRRLAWILVFLLPAPAWADFSFGVSSSPDTKTHFVWTGADRKQNAGKTLYLVVQNGGQTTGSSATDEFDVTFARADVGKIKWCSYVGTDLEIKKCKPDKALTPGGTIKIK